MKFVFIALLEENERSRNSLPDTSRHFNADSIFQANGTTEQEFRSTLAEFKADPQKWQKLLEEATKELEEREKGGSTKPKG
ncbi:MAG: hypothetical protein HW412_325 [Bacteroidetes bacterium]|nr:hypothetical protein [Bacteroidota bacterium]